MKRKIKVFQSDKGYDLAAKFYDEKEKYLNSFEQNKLIPMLGDVPDKRVLDVGAGTGRLSIMLAKRGAQVTALDVSPKMLEMIREKCRRDVACNVSTVVGDAESLPFEDNSFDIVTAAFLIVHLKDPKRFFDEVYRVLKDGGIFVVTNINQKDPPEVKTPDGNIIIESFYHRPEQVIEILKELAFGIEKEIFVGEKPDEEHIVRGKKYWVNQIILARK